MTFNFFTAIAPSSRLDHAGPYPSIVTSGPHPYLAMISAGDYYGHSTSPLTLPKPVIPRSSKTPRTSMDNYAEARRRGDDREAVVSGSGYGNHGIWPILLHAFVVGLLLWRLKMSYSILGGDLDGTPVSKNIVIWVLLPIPCPRPRRHTFTLIKWPQDANSLHRHTSARQLPPSTLFTTRGSPSAADFAT